MEKNASNQIVKDIAISLDGMPGPTLGCFMVDSCLNLLWYKPFVSNWYKPDSTFKHCFNLLNKNERCETCAALTAFSTGRPASCVQNVIGEQGGKIYYHLTASPIRESDGELSGCVEVVQKMEDYKDFENNYKDVSEFNYNILHNSPVAIFTLNKFGVITSTNPAHLKIAGYPKFKDLLGMDWLHSSNVIKSGLDYYLKKGLAGESFEVNDFPFVANLTNRKLYMTLRGVPLRNKQREIEGLLCILEDTTEKTQHLKSLEQLKKFNDNIIHSITNGIMVLDNQYQIVTWNEGMNSIFGVSSSEAFDKSLNVCLDKIGLTMLFSQITKGIEKGQTFNQEKISIYNPQRGLIYLNYKLMPLLDEHSNQSGIILFFEDITEKQKSELKYETLFKEAKDGIVVTAPEGKFLSVNPKAFELLDTHWNVIQDKRIHDIIYKDYKKLFNTNLSLIKKGKDIQPFEVKLGLHSSTTTPVEMSVSRIFDQQKIVALHFIIRDIRERLKLEKQLLQANKLSGLGEMAAGVAHEINNPVATIAGCTEELLDLLEEWKENMHQHHHQEIQTLVNMMRTHSYRCKDITQNLLSFAKGDIPTYNNIDINEIISNIISISGHTISNNRERVKLNLDPNLPFIKIDYSQIQQVFINILKNAIDATEQKGKIIITTCLDNQHVCVIFQDTGIGMSKQEQECMFDPFFTTKSPHRGTGLGLSICYRIIERLKLKTEVSSKKGIGTSFKIYIPIG